MLPNVKHNLKLMKKFSDVNKIYIEKGTLV